MPPKSSKPPSSRLTGDGQPVGRNELWILPALLAAAALVRVPGLLAGLWHDEVMYSRVYFDNPALRSWLLWRDVHPPVYALLLWLWSSILGNREAVLRLPSYLAGLGSLAATWSLTRRCFGDRVALLATAFLAFSPPHIWYSVENKANMLALFLSVLAVWWGVRAVEQPARRQNWLAMMTVLLLALGTHSYALSTAGTLLIWLGWRAWHERRLRRPVAASAAVLLAIWLPLFLWKTIAQGASLARPYLRSFDAGELYQLLLVWLPHGNTLHSISFHSPFRQPVGQPWSYFLVDALCATGVLLGLAAAVKGSRAPRDPGKEEQRPWPNRLLLLWLFPPLLVAALASLVIRRFYIERNFLLLLPAYAILLALGVARLRGTRVRAVASAGLLALALGGSFVLLVPRHDQWTVYKPKPDWRAAAAWLETEGTRAGKLAVVTTTPSLETDFYLRPDDPGRSGITVTDFCRGRLPPLFLARQGGGTFWLVKNETWLGCWAEAWRQANGAAGAALRGERHFAGLTLYEFAAR